MGNITCSKVSKEEKPLNKVSEQKEEEKKMKKISEKVVKNNIYQVYQVWAILYESDPYIQPRESLMYQFFSKERAGKKMEELFEDKDLMKQSYIENYQLKIGEIIV